MSRKSAEAAPSEAPMFVVGDRVQHVEHGRTTMRGTIQAITDDGEHYYVALEGRHDAVVTLHVSEFEAQ